MNILVCTRKVTHITRKSAVRMQDSLQDVYGVRPNCYPCPRCGFYHVGFDKEQREQFSDSSKRAYKRQH